MVLLRLRRLPQVVEHDRQVALKFHAVLSGGVGFDPGFGGAHVFECGVEVAGHAHGSAQALAHRGPQRFIGQRVSQ